MGTSVEASSSKRCNVLALNQSIQSSKKIAPFLAAKKNRACNVRRLHQVSAPATLTLAMASSAADGAALVRPFYSHIETVSIKAEIAPE